MSGWIYGPLIWLAIGFVILVVRLRKDRSFGGWMLMLSDSRHGTAGYCVAIAVMLVVFPPIHFFLHSRW